ncbi:antitoxin Xre/MbcA/ParS toxin-binding domain-containing protein [Chromobacterium sp. CV08]|uniref:antitoxin Xre/MbcA/ParS toxin-binding domain-containing protein n=1 Tax=Chromobacterium sp. CV08 TaxID=3133274 RepID=UPI003DA86D7E
MALEKWALLDAPVNEQIHAIRTGLPVSFLTLAAEQLQLPREMLCDVIGFVPHIPSKNHETIGTLDPAVSERLLRVVSFAMDAAAVLGSDVMACEWLSHHHPELGCRPLDLLDTALGATLVKRILHSISWGLPV